jgi:hypothetical protein
VFESGVDEIRDYLGFTFIFCAGMF